jgi:HD-like signal output (HDOD) protein
MPTLKADYVRLLEEPESIDSDLTEREMSAFGMTQAEVGSRLLERWQFALPIVSGVRFHNDPANAGDESTQRFAACVHLSNELALSVDPIKGEQVLAPVEPPVSLAMLNRSPQDLSRYRELITENMQFVETMCRLN